MPDFTYEALASTGAKQTGTLTAASEREAATMLDGRGRAAHLPVTTSAA